MKCKLHLKKAEILESHIIPEFMYKYAGLYDEKGRFLKIEKIKDGTGFQYKQKGLRDRLLCELCEKKISVWEDYAKRTLYGGHNPKYVKQTGQRYGQDVLFTGIDYKKFKLFLLSVLWRASATKLDEFSEVRLGLHEEKIRRMILEEDPGNENDYGCLITAVDLDNNPVEGFIIPPSPIRIKNHNCYRMLIGRLLYIFFVSKHNIPTEIQEYFLNRSNELRVLTRKIEDVPFVLATLLDSISKDKELLERKENRC